VAPELELELGSIASDWEWVAVAPELELELGSIAGNWEWGAGGSWRWEGTGAVNGVSLVGCTVRQFKENERIGQLELTLKTPVEKNCPRWPSAGWRRGLYANTLRIPGTEMCVGRAYRPPRCSSCLLCGPSCVIRRELNPVRCSSAWIPGGIRPLNVVS
jgi:hypothetical protein